MAADYLASEDPRGDLQGLRPTRLPDVWQLASPSGRTIGLYTDQTVHTVVHSVVDQHQTEAVRFAVFTPDEGAYEDALAIGPTMPGWQASFTLLDTAILERPVRARVASYVWVAALGIGVFALIAVSVGQTVRRQLRLTRLKTDLVAAVSHELRTPLASMRLLVEALLRDDEPDRQKTREYLELIAVENARLSRLIDNFLTFSRLERSRLHLSITSTEPAQVVHAAVTAMRERLHPGSDIAVEIEPGLPSIHADADALVTALLNLLDNACKYTPQEKRISVRATAEGRQVVFAVQDNGMGIPVSEQTRIFRRFYRIDRRLSRGTSGVGLGLAIVDEIARAHGGSVCVESDVGTGSTFSLRLPQADGTVA
jgi:signal transduction histidine kinase